MKWYTYLWLVVVCELLKYFSAYKYTDEPFSLLGIMYMEGSTMDALSFNPFPLFVMMCYLLNIIITTVFVTSNIPETRLIVSRFESISGFLKFISVKQLKFVTISSVAMTAIPLFLVFLTRGFFGFASITIIFLTRQLIIVYAFSGISIILRRKLNGGAADLLASTIASVLILSDAFTGFSFVLTDVSKKSIIITAVEALICFLLFVCYFMSYKRRKQIV